MKKEKTMQKNKEKSTRKMVRYLLAILILVLVIGIPVLLMFLKHSLTQKDTWCTTPHSTTLVGVYNPQNGQEFYTEGDYDFSIGNCSQAISDFTSSIELDPTISQSFNDRAYTYMRMGDYKDALTDLNSAINLNPNYVNALMNRGDINNYYLNNKPQAVKDYQRVIDLGGKNNTSVCGHILLARDSGWSITALFDLIFRLGTHLSNIHQAGC